MEAMSPAGNLGLRALPPQAARIDLSAISWLARYANRPIVVLDLETTSVLDDPFWSFGIVELGLVVASSDGQVRCASSFLNPGLPMSPDAERLTGISDASVASAPTMGAIHRELRAIVTDAIVCGHYIDSFDAPGLQRELARFGLAPLDLPMVCDTRNFLRGALEVELPSKSLAAVSTALGIHLDGIPHRALHDALLTTAVISEVVVRLGIDRFLEIGLCTFGNNRNDCVSPMPAVQDMRTIR